MIHSQGFKVSQSSVSKAVTTTSYYLAVQGIIHDGLLNYWKIMHFRGGNAGFEITLPKYFAKVIWECIAVESPGTTS